jgi:hypothetical protein
MELHWTPLECMRSVLPEDICWKREFPPPAALQSSGGWTVVRWLRRAIPYTT